MTSIKVGYIILFLFIALIICLIIYGVKLSELPDKPQHDSSSTPNTTFPAT